VISRRGLLCGAGLAGLAGFAGCTEGLAPLDPSIGTPDTRPSDTEVPPDATRRATVGSQDPPPDLPVSPRVSVVDPYAYGATPPVLRVDVDNATDRPVVAGEYRAVVFQYVRGADGPFVFLPHSERSTAGDPDRVGPPVEPTDPGCWRLDSEIATTEEYGTVEIPAGGTLTAFVGLYATPDADDCLPTGDHRFAADYAYYPDGLDGDRETATWGFTLRLEAIDPATTG